MRWKGLSETPSNKEKSLEGLCVGLFVRYPSNLHLSSGCRTTSRPVSVRGRPPFGVLEVFSDLRPDVQGLHRLPHVLQRTLHDGVAQFLMGLRELAGGDFLKDALGFVCSAVVNDPSRIARVRHQKRHDRQQQTDDDG